jgi:hypothetical protein
VADADPFADFPPKERRKLMRALKLRTYAGLIGECEGDDFFTKLIAFTLQLEAEPDQLKVVRLTRIRQSAENDGVPRDTNRINVLSTDDVQKLWDKPVLRFSNVLDSLFHSTVVLCEDESDCRFLSAVLHAIQEPDGPRIDVMFVGCSGKDRIAPVAASIKPLGVSVRAVVDFDVLREETSIRRLVETFGGEWAAYQPAWRRVKKAVDEKSPSLNLNQVRDKVKEIFDRSAQEGAVLREEDTAKIRKALRAASPWLETKRSGVQAVPSGGAHTAAKRLLDDLRSLRINVIPCGEIERFVPDVGGHGAAWVASVLETYDLAKTPELKEARKFVGQMVATLIGVSPTVYRDGGG